MSLGRLAASERASRTTSGTGPDPRQPCRHAPHRPHPDRHVPARGLEPRRLRRALRGGRAAVHADRRTHARRRGSPTRGPTPTAASTPGRARRPWRPTSAGPSSAHCAPTRGSPPCPRRDFTVLERPTRITQRRARRGPPRRRLALRRLGARWLARCRRCSTSALSRSSGVVASGRRCWSSSSATGRSWRSCTGSPASASRRSCAPPRSTPGRAARRSWRWTAAPSSRPSAGSSPPSATRSRAATAASSSPSTLTSACACSTRGCGRSSCPACRTTSAS